FHSTAQVYIIFLPPSLDLLATFYLLLSITMISIYPMRGGGRERVFSNVSKVFQGLVQFWQNFGTFSNLAPFADLGGGIYRVDLKILRREGSSFDWPERLSNGLMTWQVSLSPWICFDVFLFNSSP
ncbi:hypothetical protein, partial [Mesorhizobium amorphae]|uniref:hypothetical protein n=1 Tax=Mesorhizobium amorphae TaxID=71433 RepID=UPI0024E093B9